jgi:oligoribonuclease (3'-5' exoribonuclease)
MIAKQERLVFGGVDGEMSGTDPCRHKLIQIGVALSELHVFSSRIGWQDAAYEVDALRAIGMSVEELADGPPAEEVDEQLVNWLLARDIQEHGIIPVGWGVSTFDLPFIMRQLPRFHAYLHRHAVELNSLVYFLGGTARYHGRLVTSAGWKQMAKRAAGSHVYYTQARQLKSHDAGDDALSAILGYGWLRDIVRQSAGIGDAEGVLERRLALQATVDATQGPWV